MKNKTFNSNLISSLFIMIFLPAGIFAQNWQSDFEKAKQLATQENKPIILIFSGSDWCAPCMKLEKEIWQSEVFKNYSDKNYILYKADFPRKKKNQPVKEQAKANKALAEQYNKKGYFPLVVVLNKNAKVLGETGYKKMMPEVYIKHLDSFLK